MNKVHRRSEDGWWSMHRGDIRMVVEAGAPYLGDGNGVTVRLIGGAMGFSIELDAESADALAAWLKQWQRLRNESREVM